jgi:hypothetical protein
MVAEEMLIVEVMEVVVVVVVVVVVAAVGMIAVRVTAEVIVLLASLSCS